MKTGLVIALLAGLSIPTGARAEEWTALGGPEIRAALEGQKLIYGDGVWQTFQADGRTLYNAGRDSWGRWSVRDAQYCSTWPPNDLWTCYDIQRQGQMIRFIGRGGDVTDGRLVD
ncbi:MAG: hypothetical protein MRY77_03170 [Rhodobacteraceae bacterium]|nr:hypothetical protein [Paracoccaceae bacterium]